MSGEVEVQMVVTESLFRTNLDSSNNCLDLDQTRRVTDKIIEKTHQVENSIVLHKTNKKCPRSVGDVEPDIIDDSDEDPDYAPEVESDKDSDYAPSDSDILNSKKEKKKQRRVSVSSSSSNKVYTCSYKDCGKEFSKPSRLTQHSRIHTGERPFACPAEGCSRSYTRQQHLKRHIETTHVCDSQDEKIECDKCDKTFANKYTLRKHIYRYHVRSAFTCGVCGQVFKKQQHLKTHSFAHTGIKPYECDFPGCEVRCENPSRLKRHSFTHKKSRYACPVENCEQVFDFYQDLQKHLSISHMKVCDVCGRTFRQLRKLRIHRNTHEDEREAYFCPLPNCDKYFYQENNLLTHIKEKHEKSKIYQCSICNKCLATKQKLTNHMATHAPDYKRNYTSKKPRKPRKDKGVSRTDYARLLSGYHEDEDEELVTGDSRENGEVKNMETNCNNVNSEEQRSTEEDQGDEEMECEMTVETGI